MFKRLFSTLLLFSMALLSLQVSVLQAIAADAIERPSFDFTGVAKKVIPAVASIKVVSKKSSALSSSDSISDFFNEDFLRKFFGFPGPRGGREQEDERQVVGQASGFIVSADGLLLTNSHVVKDASEIEVILQDGRIFSAKLVGQDPNTDIALIKIDATNLPFLTFTDSDQLQVGEWAIAVGSPWGLRATLTVGVISAKGRNNLNLTQWEDFIQTDAAINLGNSGGPLLNYAGKVVGMNTAIVSSIGSGGNLGIGFAIPSNLIKHVTDELLATGKVTRGYIGVVLQQLDQNLAKAFNLDRPEGAIVADVIQDSPAAKAGLKQGDIVLKYNNQQVTNVATLRNAIALMAPDTKVTLTLLREGKQKEVAVVIGAYPSQTSQKPVEAEVQNNKYGFSVQELTPEIAQSQNYGDLKGVVVAQVEPGTPAALAGLRKDALILAVNQTKVSSVEEFNKAIGETEKGKPLLLLVKQKEGVLFITLLVE